jgi:hypothetical protein
MTLVGCHWPASQCDPKVVLPYSVEQIIMAAETVRETECIVPGDGREGR